MLDRPQRCLGDLALFILVMLIFLHCALRVARVRAHYNSDIVGRYPC